MCICLVTTSNDPSFLCLSWENVNIMITAFLQSTCCIRLTYRHSRWIQSKYGQSKVHFSPDLLSTLHKVPLLGTKNKPITYLVFFPGASGWYVGHFKTGYSCFQTYWTGYVVLDVWLIVMKTQKKRKEEEKKCKCNYVIQDLYIYIYSIYIVCELVPWHCTDFLNSYIQIRTSLKDDQAKMEALCPAIPLKGLMLHSLQK